ncbi:hypothetical protein AWR27_14300 [Spirosoma montaniterrae]|uniref:Uncharacterized protein n=2 Tax=Spirosoma montaniterrae TaxID=1178516 RepID=A0A1P9WYD7_9BACT|nr:hypothetical protein AWR27_14300 [Spirosoma montaniterrae]
MITRISDISYNVVFSIDKDEQFDAVFTLTGDKLIGTKKTLFSDIEQTLYLSNNNELYFENEKTFFARIGKPSTSHSGEKPVLQGTLQDFLWNAFKGARVGFVGVILYVAYLFIRSLVSKK